jgi:hypothetical protein
MEFGRSCQLPRFLIERRPDGRIRATDLHIALSGEFMSETRCRL